MSWWDGEVLQERAVLVINQPTWGVDAGAALAIHEAIMALAEAGAAVMIISQESPDGQARDTAALLIFASH